MQAVKTQEANSAKSTDPVELALNASNCVSMAAERNAESARTRDGSTRRRMQLRKPSVRSTAFLASARNTAGRCLKRCPAFNSLNVPVCNKRASKAFVADVMVRAECRTQAAFSNARPCQFGRQSTQWG